MSLGSSSETTRVKQNPHFGQTMNFHRIVCFFIIILMLNEVLVSGQKSKKKPKKKQKRKKQDFRNRVQCFECYGNYAKRSPFYDECLNPASNPDYSIDNYLAVCPEASRVCQLDITRLNGILLTYERRCATNCQCLCKNDGYGLETELCSECYEGIDPQLFDNETSIVRTCIPHRLLAANSSARIAFPLKILLLCLIVAIF